MADIKIREVNKGSIKTFDFAEAAAFRMKDSYIRTRIKTKEGPINNDSSREKNASAAAYDEMNAGAVSAANAAGSLVRRNIKTESRKLSDPVERGREKFRSARIQEAGRKSKAQEKILQGSQNSEKALDIKTRSRRNSRQRNEASHLGSVQQRQRRYWLSKARQNGTKGDIIHRMKVILLGDPRKRSSGRILRTAARSISLQNMTATAAGALAILIVVMITFFGSAFYSPGGEEYSDDPTPWNVYGNGSAALVRVAAKEIGNVGGDKYWKWYGFSSHVHWCACFVSWCENECGLLKTESAPKFALVSGGANWFKKKGQWAGRSYTPKPGDIVFFDWESDGEMDHVGIVETADGKTVHTIEGNSSNACRRQVYTRGRAPIVGYGLIYTAPALNAQKIAAKAIELAYSGAPSEAKYPGGRPTAAYAAALNRAYPKRSSWGAAPRAGASCDVFVGVCVVDSGVDPNFPRGLAKQWPYLEKSDAFECVIETTSSNLKESELRDGDIITYRNSSGGGHICIYAGGKLRHASYKKWYGRTTGPGGRLKISGKKWIRVYRAKR